MRRSSPRGAPSATAGDRPACGKACDRDSGRLQGSASPQAGIKRRDSAPAESCFAADYSGRSSFARLRFSAAWCVSSPSADHGQEDEAHDEHRENDASSFLGGIRQQPDAASIAAILSDPLVVRGERLVHRSSPAAARARRVERRPDPAPRAGPGARRRARPAEEAAVAAQAAPSPAAVGTSLRAEREQLGEVGDRVHRAGRRDADETVGESAVAEQEGDVVVRRREEPRATVVQEVALVDRLDARARSARRRGAARRRARGSRRSTGRSASAHSAALRGRARGDRREDVLRGHGRHANDVAAAIVASTCSSVCASDGKRHSNCDGGR